MFVHREVYQRSSKGIALVLFYEVCHLALGVDDCAYVNQFDDIQYLPSKPLTSPANGKNFLVNTYAWFAASAMETEEA